MLDTVIKIGKLYREAPNAYKYHEQINSVWKDVEALKKQKDKEGNVIDTTFYNLPVLEKNGGFVFDFGNISEIIDEDKQKKLFYLNFKTSKKDAEKRYLLGDIAYCHYEDKKGKLNEFGNYRLFGKWEKRTSFIGAEEVSRSIQNDFIKHFRNEYRDNKEQIEDLLKSRPSVVIHFSYNGGGWLSVPNLITAIDELISSNLITKDEVTGKYVLTKYLYKTLGGVTPGFGEDNRYKNKLFTIDQIISLMYATQAYQDPAVRINNIGIIALPHSDKFEPCDIVDFFDKKKNKSEDESRKNITRKESDIKIGSGDEEFDFFQTDEILAPFVDNSFDNKVKFDIIFSSIPKSPAGVYTDLIEISNVEKSLLSQVNNIIEREKFVVRQLASQEFPKTKKPFTFSIRNSFLKILGDVTKDKKKFQSHLLKVLPQIYLNTYYQDPIILPAFIEKVEHNIRDGGQLFGTLKYDFYFLMNIQINNTLMNIINTKSYTLGQNLGVMARQFAAWRDDCPIKSFEKSYVGNLSRRITSIEEVVKFASFLNEKLTMHDRLYKDVKEAYLNLVATVGCFEGEKYNKYNCSLGFFESYYGKSSTTENK